MELRNPAFSAVGSFFSAVGNSLLTLLYPQSCRICDQSVEFKADGFVCAECWESTRFFSGSEVICRKCSAFLNDGASSAEVLCHRCDPDDYDLARCAGFYEKALAVSVLNLKDQPFIPARLENLIRRSFDETPFHDANLVIPVPLSNRRRIERGYNQAALIARIISKYKNLPFDETSLKRIVHTEKHRAGMDRKARLESVKNAFEVKDPKMVEGKNILLVDDVLTSGATVSNCAKALKKNGAAKVYVFTIARAL